MKFETICSFSCLQPMICTLCCVLSSGAAYGWDWYRVCMTGISVDMAMVSILVFSHCCTHTIKNSGGETGKESVLRRIAGDKLHEKMKQFEPLSLSLSVSVSVSLSLSLSLSLSFPHEICPIFFLIRHNSNDCQLYGCPCKYQLLVPAQCRQIVLLILQARKGGRSYPEMLTGAPFRSLGYGKLVAVCVSVGIRFLNIEGPIS